MIVGVAHVHRSRKLNSPSEINKTTFTRISFHNLVVISITRIVLPFQIFFTLEALLQPYFPQCGQFFRPLMFSPGYLDFYPEIVRCPDVIGSTDVHDLKSSTNLWGTFNYRLLHLRWVWCTALYTNVQQTRSDKHLVVILRSKFIDH